MRRRKFMVIAAVVALVAAGLAWWMDWRVRPVVRFVGFRHDGSERVAVFEIENRSARTIHFSRSAVARSRKAEGEVPAEWKVQDSGSGLPFARPSSVATHPDERVEFKVSISEVAGIAPGPFRVGFAYPQPAPKFLHYPPFSWLPLEIRSMKTMWSETVTP